jgi:peptidyl-prolyl cis-trans isomerase SurA
MKQEVNSIINRDERAQAGRNALVAKLKQAYHFQLNEPNYQAFIVDYDKLRLTVDSTGVVALMQSEAPLFTLGTMTCPQKQFALYIKSNPLSVNNLASAFDAFVKDQVIAYEDSQLEKKYPDFGHLMQEYRDGLLLFEISNREVWDKATTDVSGLEAYFKAHKKDYAWEKPHFKGFVIRCANEEVAGKAKKMLKKLPADSVAVVLKRTFNTDTTTLVRIERGVYAQGDHPVVDSILFKQKGTKQDKLLPVAFLSGRILKKGPEAYTDVRGLVITDYQTYLEEKWVEGLRKKYEVVLYPEVLKTVNNN